MRPTAGFCPGYVQANLVVVPAESARDFREFCRRNPAPCPLLETVGPGSHRSSVLAPGADLLTELPQYRVWEYGVLTSEPGDIRDLYREDWVFFLLGCSFTFEEDLAAAGVPLRHHREDRNVSMYRTSIPLDQVGPFGGTMVVSMRPIPSAMVEKVRRITGAHGRHHGAPVHVGAPEAIGIADLDRPEYGDRARMRKGDVPVFWACGVTPQEALRGAALPLAVTHAPGHMFVGDLRAGRRAPTPGDA